jgi:hypothetical protein
MKNFTPIATANEEWGFWGTSKQNGYDADLTWETTSHFLAKHFDLTPEQTRDVLDSRFGRHLADDLSFIKSEERGIASGPSSEKAITRHLESRIADKGWRDSFENAIRQETGKTYRRKTKTKDELFTEIAQQHLLVETLVTRKSDSLDFHNVAVWNIQAALEAAYEAGRAAKR